VSENTVASVMRELGLAARQPRRCRGTTRPARGCWRGAGPGQAGLSSQINRKWYGDGTEICTGEGKLLLASVLDMGSRRVLGFALSEHHDTAVVYGALAMAGARRPGAWSHPAHRSRQRIHRQGLPPGVPAVGHSPVDGPPGMPSMPCLGQRRRSKSATGR
jgi:transposase InsO family protein